jgi:hypothetical protein
LVLLRPPLLLRLFLRTRTAGDDRIPTRKKEKKKKKEEETEETGGDLLEFDDDPIDFVPCCTYDLPGFLALQLVPSEKGM